MTSNLRTSTKLGIEIGRRGPPYELEKLNSSPTVSAWPGLEESSFRMPATTSSIGGTFFFLFSAWTGFNTLLLMWKIPVRRYGPTAPQGAKMDENSIGKKIVDVAIASELRVGAY